MYSDKYGKNDINDLLTSYPLSNLSGTKTTVLSSYTNRDKKPNDIKKKEDDKKSLNKKIIAIIRKKEEQIIMVKKMDPKIVIKTKKIKI